MFFVSFESQTHTVCVDQSMRHTVISIVFKSFHLFPLCFLRVISICQCLSQRCQTFLGVVPACNLCSIKLIISIFIYLHRKALRFAACQSGINTASNPKIFTCLPCCFTCFARNILVFPVQCTNKCGLKEIPRDKVCSNRQSRLHCQKRQT